MTLGEKLKEARQQFGWSQEELAFKVTNKKFELGNYVFTVCGKLK